MLAQLFIFNNENDLFVWEVWIFVMIEYSFWWKSWGVRNFRSHSKAWKMWQTFYVFSLNKHFYPCLKINKVFNLWKIFQNHVYFLFSMKHEIIFLLIYHEINYRNDFIYNK